MKCPSYSCHNYLSVHTYYFLLYIINACYGIELMGFKFPCNQSMSDALSHNQDLNVVCNIVR